MNIVTDSIWYFGHPETIKFLSEKKNLYKVIFNSDESGKINLCINENLQKKDEPKSIPLAKFLVERGYINENAHYYVEYKDDNRYSIFFKDGAIYPFSDKVCSDSLVESLKSSFGIDKTEVVFLKKEDTMLLNSKEISIDIRLLVKVCLPIFIISSIASLAYFFL